MPISTLAQCGARVCWPLGLVLVALACEHQRSSASRHTASDLVGCYRITAPERPLLGMPTVRPPRVVALDTAVVPGDPNQRAILTWDGEHSQYMFRAWSFDSITDTVRLTFSRGLHGYVFALRGEGDTLTGHLSEWSDVPPYTWEQGPAAAHRVPCDSSAAPAT